jgi:hypothetical protein
MSRTFAGTARTSSATAAWSRDAGENWYTAGRRRENLRTLLAALRNLEAVFDAYRADTAVSDVTPLRLRGSDRPGVYGAHGRRIEDGRTLDRRRTGPTTARPSSTWAQLPGS